MTKGDLPLEERLVRMEAKIDWLVEHVTVLRVKAGFYGATGGVVFGAITGALVARLV